MDTHQFASGPQLLSQTWWIYRERFVTLIAIAFPITAWFFFWYVQADVERPLLEATFSRFIAVGVYALIAGILGVLTQAAFIKNLKEDFNPGFKAAYSASFNNLFPYVWVSVLSALAVFGGYVLLIIPGVLLSVWLYFSLFAAVVEEERGANALLKSREYVRGRWWAVVWRLFFVVLVVLPFSIAIGLIQEGFFGQNLLGNLLSQGFYLLLMPFGTIYSYLLYRQLQSTYVPSGKSPRKVPLFVIAAIGLLAIIGVVWGSVYFMNFLKNLEAQQQPQQQQQQRVEYYIDPMDAAQIFGGQILADYVVENLNLGYSQEIIRAELLKSNWQTGDIDRVFETVRTR